MINNSYDIKKKSMKSKSVTLMDIAQSLDVSVVTVSKALRGHPDISKQTTLLVIETAKNMGYSPNFMARNLASKKTFTIGLVVPKIAHFFFGAIIEAIYDKAIQNNYEIILMVSQENAKQEKKHLQTLMSMRVDGIIISITQETKNSDIFYRVKNMGVPLVFVDRCVDQSPAELGQKAVDLILNQINDPENFTEQHVELPTELILRGTCIQKNDTSKRDF